MGEITSLVEGLVHNQERPCSMELIRDKEGNEGSSFHIREGRVLATLKKVIIEQFNLCVIKFKIYKCILYT
jgi:hypothetical protein